MLERRRQRLFVQRINELVCKPGLIRAANVEGDPSQFVEAGAANYCDQPILHANTENAVKRWLLLAAIPNISFGENAFPSLEAG
jgi:hypothetical protein